MLGQVSLRRLQKLWAGERIEEVHCLDLLELLTDESLVLLRSELRSTITHRLASAIDWVGVW